MAAGRTERGFALLLVLWATVLLAFLATQVVSVGRVEARLALNIRLAAVAEAAADGAVEEAAYHLVDTGAGHWAADGLVRTLGRPGAAVRVRLDSEAGKVNPNTASPALLTALLTAAGADTSTAAAVAAAMVAWRYPAARGGALAPAYQAAGRDYAPPGARFQSLDEIGLVLGMTPALLERLRPNLSLFHDGDPDLSQGTPAVRAALQALGVAAGGEQPDDRAVTVTATAAGQDGTRFTRRAVVVIGAGRNGSLFQVVDWGIGEPVVGRE